MKTKAMILCTLLIFLTACSALSRPSDPTPGATYSGPIDMRNYAKTGDLTFRVASDGALIEEITLVLTEIKCDGMIGGKMTSIDSVSIPITNGVIEDTETEYELTGTFSSPTEASGKIKVVILETQCGAGSFDWTAMMK